MGRINVLSMDGGGIRGIIAAAILEALRAQIGRELHEVFDLISGTSTGGIIALGIGTKSSTSRRPDRPPVGLPLANSLATQASARWARSSGKQKQKPPARAEGFLKSNTP